jgi:hypothetical protein
LLQRECREQLEVLLVLLFHIQKLNHKTDKKIYHTIYSELIHMETEVIKLRVHQIQFRHHRKLFFI